MPRHDEDERDHRIATIYDEEALELMQHWTGGTDDPLYAVSSMGSRHEVWVFQNALTDIDRDLRRVLKVGRDKYQLGKGTFSKKDIDELHIIRDALQNAIDEAEEPDEGLEEARGAVVRDFNTMQGLIEHAQAVDGATHVLTSGTQTTLYFPTSKGQYEEAKVWAEGGYWHTQARSNRTVVDRLPPGAKPIEGAGRHRAASGRHAVQDYEAVDHRDRRVAGPFKHYSDAKREADKARGYVKYVPGAQARPVAAEAFGRRTRWPDWEILDAIDKGNMVTPEAEARAVQLAQRGLIDTTGTWRLTAKGRRALDQRMPVAAEIVEVDGRHRHALSGAEATGTLTLGKPEKHRSGFGARQYTVERTPVFDSSGREIGAIQRRYTKNRAIDAMTTHHASKAAVQGYNLAWLERQEAASAHGGLEEGAVAARRDDDTPTEEDAELAGARYAQEQIEGQHFQDWVHEQTIEAERMRKADPSSVLPLETLEDAKKIARNMLQQLEWDTKKELDPREVLGRDAPQADVRAFFEGFTEELHKPEVRQWLADLILEDETHARRGEAREAPQLGTGEPALAEPELVPFNSWKEVLAHAHSGGPLFYKAPMDQRATRLAPRTEQGQEAVYEAHARTIRIWPYGSIGRGKKRTADPFTADSGHLDRFLHPGS